MYTEQHNPNKVIVPREEVAEYCDAHPDCGLNRARAYWFEFDQDGEEVDCDVPGGLDASELSAMAWQWLQDNGPLLRDGVERAVIATPGPWEVKGTNPPMIYARGGLDIIAQCDSTGEMTRAQELANAQFIAAAPDLLKALRDIADACALISDDAGHSDQFRNGWGRAHAKLGAFARAAIAKATGGRT